MYLLAFSEADDAGPGGDPTAPQGARTDADRDRSARERQPVDDREDREAADEPVVRQREADHERPPGGAEASGEESARGPDPEPQGPVCGGEDPARIRVDEVMEPAFPQVDSKAPVELAAGLLRHYDAVLVTAKGEVTGIVTKSDLMKLL